MRTIRLTRPSAAMCVALTALVASLGGSAFAAITVTSSMIRNNSVASVDVADNSLLSRDIRNGSLYLTDLAPGTRTALRGAPGPAGANGAPGAPGATGAQGPAGPTASAFKRDTKSVALDLNGELVEFISIAVTTPSRLMVTAQVQVSANSASELVAACRLDHQAPPSSTLTPISNAPGASVAPDSTVPVTVLGSVVVEPGTHFVYLFCHEGFGITASASDPTISVIATAT